MRRIKAGIIGMGFIGPVHLEALRRLGGIDVCIAKNGMEPARKAAQQYGVEEYFGGWEEMVEDPSVEVIHICTPNNLHYSIAKSALLAGKHVVCDKPLTMDLGESAELVRLAGEKGLVNAVTFNTFYYPLVLEAMQRIHAGELGEIRFLQGFYLQDWLLYDTDYNWRVEAELGGPSRVIGDIGVHCLYMLQKVIGQRIEKVYADFNTFIPRRRKPLQKTETYGKSAGACETVEADTEDQATLLLRFDGGAKGVFIGGQAFAGRKNKLGFEIYGSKRSIGWDAESPNQLWIGERDAANHTLMKDFNLLQGQAASMCGFAGGLQEGFSETWKNLMRRIYAAVRQAVHTEGDYPTFADGHDMQKVADACLRSSKTEQWIKTE